MCAVWSVTLREERRLRVSGYRVLREMFRTEREEVTRNWRTLQHEELRALRCLPNLIRVIKLKSIRWVGGACGLCRKVT